MVIFTWWPLCVTRPLSWERSKLGLAQKSFLHNCAIIPQSEKTLSPMCKSEIWGFQNAFAFPFFCFCYRLVKNANVLSLYVSWWKVVGWWFHKRGIKKLDLTWNSYFCFSEVHWSPIVREAVDGWEGLCRFFFLAKIRRIFSPIPPFPLPSIWGRIQRSLKKYCQSAFEFCGV